MHGEHLLRPTPNTQLHVQTGVAKHRAIGPPLPQRPCDIAGHLEDGHHLAGQLLQIGIGMPQRRQLPFKQTQHPKQRFGIETPQSVAECGAGDAIDPQLIVNGWHFRQLADRSLQANQWIEESVRQCRAQVKIRLIVNEPYVIEWRVLAPPKNAGQYWGVPHASCLPPPFSYTSRPRQTGKSSDKAKGSKLRGEAAREFARGAILGQVEAEAVLGGSFFEQAGDDPLVVHPPRGVLPFQ